MNQYRHFRESKDLLGIFTIIFLILIYLTFSISTEYYKKKGNEEIGRQLTIIHKVDEIRYKRRVNLGEYSIITGGQFNIITSDRLIIGSGEENK